MCEDEFFLRRRRFYLIFFRGIVYFLPRMKPGNRKREKEKDGTRNQIFPIGRLIRSPSFSTDRFFKKNRSPITGFSLDPFGWIRWSKRFFGCRKHPHPVLIGWPPTGQWRGVWLCFFFNLLVPKANWVVPFCLLLLLVLLRFKGFVGFNPYRNELESGFLEFNSEFYGIVLGLTGFDRV